MADEYADDVSSTGSDSPMVTITLRFRKTKYEFHFHEDATVTDLFDEIEATLDIPVANQKIIIPKAPLLTSPAKDPTQLVQTLQGKSLMLMGSGASTVQAMQDMADRVSRRNAARQAQSRKLKTSRSKTKRADSSPYTFLQVRPLDGLPNPGRSQALLMRLKADPGIVATMKKHKFTVSLLTEMEPLSYTQETHEGTSRILGLNRNHGEVIELRLRTDAHDGYRDYKTIRKTLCHELAHNVHGDHDRQFWDLCHQIEREVDAADWKSGGHTIAETSRYHISGRADVNGGEEAEDHEDDGGWQGGEFVLGGVQSGGASAGLSRREILARAAMERQRKDAESEQKAEKGWRPCQRSPPRDEAS
ncbi:unnamed protein product [Clonostachys rhizophaga]|uniref:WLM domain-containing protein n=1 Tax=Clonostachys rhizophaga TaxID=160324 RepID=A0A9N9W0K4_9HYPO|nr:unnamed protein product [Clonostachys rhizophaga]